MITETIHRDKLLQKFKHKLSEDKYLSRQLVSFQANKTSPKYRWFKYKEGFSANLINYYIEKFNLQKKRILDPFAGVGTSLFASSDYGCKSTGIELLPVGVYVMQQKAKLDKININEFKQTAIDIWDKVENIKEYKNYIKHIPITKEAFPETTEILLNKYLTYTNNLNNGVSSLLNFVAFSVLEDISYTRKDGQYLRWDYRSNRTLRQKFNKGKIEDFKTAINSKFNDIIADLSKQEQTLFPSEKKYEKGDISVIEGSCLYKLPEIASNSHDFIITSPPYANRYDYTRTYALELIFLGNDNNNVKKLRQDMLSCTVENKSKIEELHRFYTEQNRLDDYNKIISTYESNKALIEILTILEKYKQEKKLNNNGVLRLVQNYFLEMCFTIFEMARVLDKNGKIIMVNDNVKYAGEEIPVDLILSDFAEKFGLSVENIFVLSQKKGNSSQQMGVHGRTPLRKCVYLWQKK
ncbi:MAG: hypothetical protein K8R54_15560 [Bacteroidales bacterium]|nr:hypothetical protein [Bacteroidales bacterium]